MSSICLGMVADFDERAGDYPAAIKTLEAAIATNESLLGGFTGSLQARLGWVLLHDGQTRPGRGGLPAGARLGPPGAPHVVIFQAQAGLAALHRLHGRDDAAGRGRHRGAGALPGRRVPPVPEPHRPHSRPAGRAAVCCEVLAAIAAERGRAGTGGGAARPGRRLRIESGVDVPAVLQRDVVRAREAAMAGPGADAFRAAFERGAARQRGHPPRLTGSSAPARPQVSALLDGAVVPQAAGPHPRRIP